MRVTAQLSLNSRTENVGGHHQLVFGPDYGDGRNKEWAASTPSLNLSMTVKPEVSALFKVGGQYTLTLTEQEDPA